jgi:hypothetical protein
MTWMKGATVNGVTYEGVAEFIHLGTLISNGNSVEKEIQRLSWSAVELISPLKVSSGTDCYPELLTLD